MNIEIQYSFLLETQSFLDSYIPHKHILVLCVHKVYTNLPANALLLCNNSTWNELTEPHTSIHQCFHTQ